MAMFCEYEDYEDYMDDAEEFERENSYDDVDEVDDDEDERYVLSPWGCMTVAMSDYNIDWSHLTPKMGQHFVEDFMKYMESAGHVVRRGDDDNDE